MASYEKGSDYGAESYCYGYHDGQSMNRKQTASEKPVHNLYGEQRFLSPEIAPPHVAESQPPRLQPTPNSLLTRFSDVEIDKCAYHAPCCHGR